MQKTQMATFKFIRQILKQLNYTMEPYRKSAGYDETGKKYERFFKLKKMKSVEEKKKKH